jgi:TonB family protein
MFETVVAVTSPERSHLAGPAAALAHSLALAGLLGAAWWNAGEPRPPDRFLEPEVVFRVAIGRPDTAGGGGRPAGPKMGTPHRVESTTLNLNRLPIATPAEGPDEAQAGDPNATVPGAGGNPVAGPDGPGSCPTCPVGPPAGDDRPLPPGGNVLAPILIERVDPIYPEAMRRARQEGFVVLEAIIGRNGSIEETRVVSATNALFEEAALRAVTQWRYRPGRLSDQPVRVILQVTVSFRLR